MKMKYTDIHLSSNTNGYRYRLERYRACGVNRYTCPHCGKKKSFTRYIDTETGEYVDEQCGKCDHESACGYHYSPREFFHDHPWARPREEHATEYVNGHPIVSLSHHSADHYQRSHVTVMPQEPQHQSEFFSFGWVEQVQTRTSPFRQWMEQLPLPQDRVARVLDEYYVGATANDTLRDGTNYGPSVIFWQIDEQRQVHDGKMMAYTSDGHRAPNVHDTVRAFCQRRHVGPQLEQTEKVLFGLHLLHRYPEKTVSIVESEKTALICACHWPNLLWMATGGCGNLQTDKLKPLMDRKLIVWPDSGEYEKWKRCVEESGHPHCTVMDTLEAFPSNTDLADLLLSHLLKPAAAAPAQPSSPASATAIVTPAKHATLPGQVTQAGQQSNPIKSEKTQYGTV